jgi:hypothetical protein
MVRWQRVVLAGLAPILTVQMAAAEPTPGYNHEIPKQIMTPDVVETRIGKLEFFDGSPLPETAERVLDHLDFLRGVETFLNGIPATSIEGLRLGQMELGAKAPNQVVLFDRLMDSAPLFLTGNTDTVYASAFLDLRQGAAVVEIPPGCGPGTVNDAYFRFVVDMGIPGPDQGKGGIYVILSPDDEGPLDPPPGGMATEMEIAGQKRPVFVAKSTSYMNWLILRGFLVDGKPDAASALFKEGLKIYPLAQAASPPAMEFISGSEKPFNTIHANDEAFYEELHEVIEREPVSMLDPELRGLFAAIGIQKGRPFEPDERMKTILADAVAVGNATARAIWIRPRMEGVYLYEGSGWYTGFVGGSHEWLRDGGSGGRFLDARTLFFYFATVNTPAMVEKMVGKGSQYAANSLDSEGGLLDGGASYALEIPANVPAKDFWSIVAYDPQTRSQLQTSQPFPARNNERHELLENEDGSITLHFGPKAPPGRDVNWIQTVPGKGWFILLRLYGPTEAWFDGSWRPGEIVKQP